MIQGTKILRVGTRSSKLALAQTEIFVKSFKSYFPSFEIEIVPIKTYGDINTESHLTGANEVGAFTKALEDSLLKNEIDCAVHSAKDLPSAIYDDLTISCALKRANPKDAIIFTSKCTLDSFPQNCLLGTNSPRRIAQIKRLRHDLRFKNIRGNIDTRLRKFESGEYEALIVASAGFERLNLSDKISGFLSLDECLPAAGQGIIAIETRKNAHELNELLEKLTHHDSFIALKAERACLKELNAGCSIPLGIYANVEKNKVNLKARLLNIDGSVMLESKSESLIGEAEELGKKAVAGLFKKGGKALLDG